MGLFHRRRGKPLCVLENLNRGACIGPTERPGWKKAASWTGKLKEGPAMPSELAVVSMGQAAGLSGTTHYNSPQRDNREAVYTQ